MIAYSLLPSFMLAPHTYATRALGRTQGARKERGALSLIRYRVQFVARRREERTRGGREKRKKGIPSTEDTLCTYRV